MLCASIAGLIGAQAALADPGSAPTPGSPATEVVSMRTAKSSTFRDASGGFVTKISETPINFRDASGDWRKIDTGLDDNGTDRIHNESGPVQVGLPTELGTDPIRVAHNDEWVSFDPAGLTDATGVVTGSSVSYPAVADDAKAVYEALPTGLKETLVLGSSDAPSRYHYAIDTSSTLRPRLADDGSVEIVRADDSVAFVMATPTVQERGGVPTTDHVRFELAADHRSVDVVVDGSWLSGADYPVNVDPGATLANTTGCALHSGNEANVSSCGASLDAGVDTTGRAHRAIDRFDIAGAAIPRDASVMWANMLVQQTGFAGTGALNLDLYRLNHAYSGYTTWNKYDGTNAWATAGGDVPSAAETRVTTSSSNNGKTLTFSIQKLVQGWIDQSVTNNGVLLRSSDETTQRLAALGNASSTSTRPTLQIFWTFRTGLRSEGRSVTFPLSTKSTASVNVANGNLALRATDFNFATAFDYTRTYNLRDEGWGGPNGFNWDNETGFATGVRLMRNDEDNSYTYKGPAGTWYRFDRNPAGDAALTNGDLAYNSPLGLNVKLVQHTNKYATMTDQNTGIRYEFDRYDWGGYLLSKTDTANHTMRYNVRATNDVNDHDELASIVDANGHVSQVHYPTAAAARADYVTDSSGAQWKYSYDPSENLTKVTAPDNKTQTYTYGPSRSLTTATSDTGQLVVFGYDATNTQVTSMRQVVNGTASTVGSEDQTYTFDYTPQGTNPCPATDPNHGGVAVIGRTNVTNPDGTVTTYCYNAADQIVDTTPPINIGVNGPLYDAHDSYIAATSPIAINVAARDTQIGLSKLAVEEVNGSTLASQNIPCPGTGCPVDGSALLNADLTGLPEGVHLIRAVATDVYGNKSTSDSWPVTIDRTGPQPPSDFASDGFDATAGQVTIGWDPGVDPVLPGPVPSSGIVRAEARYRVGSGNWATGFLPTDGVDQLTVGGVTSGQSVSVEVRTYDAIGNVSATTAATVVVSDDPNNPVDVVDYDIDDSGNPTTTTTARAARPFPCQLGRSGKKPDYVTGDEVPPEALIHGEGFLRCTDPRGVGLRKIRVEVCVRSTDYDRQNPVSITCDAVEKAVDEIPGVAFAKANVDIPCRPGLRDYSVKATGTVYYKVPDPQSGRLTYRKRFTTGSNARDCNAAGIWRYLGQHDVPYNSAFGVYSGGWKKLADARRVTPSAVLRGSKTRAGEPAPTSDDWAAHHMVATGYTGRTAPDSQAAAYKCHINPNNNANGVWLRDSGLRSDTTAYLRNLTPQQQKRAYHPAIHTSTYFTAVANRLTPLVDSKQQCSESQAKSQLQAIKGLLEVDAFPYTPGDQDPEDPDD